MPEPIPSTSLDLMSADMATDPWPALATVRELGPVVWHSGYERWFVTRDRPARKLLSDFHRFTVEGTTVESLFGADAFISMDDRRKHDRLRNVWADAFRKQGLDTLRPAIKRIVRGLVAPVVARLKDGETVDVSKAICRPLPTLVIARMMGLPEEALPDVVRWSDAMAAGGPAYQSDERARSERDDAKQGLADYMTQLLVERRASPGEDLVSILATSEPGRALADAQLVQNLRQLLFAGNETSAKWLAQIFVIYGEKPAIWQALREDRGLIADANDEVMRWQPVVGSVVRRVRGGPVDVGGIELEDGAEITCLIGAANRDPARYQDPDRFDIRRATQPNLGFGVGLHNCLGSVLAKQEAELLIDHVLDALPSYDIAEPYTFTTLPMRGPLPVVLAAC